jgi:hypothetical protein
MKAELMKCANGEHRLLFWCPGCDEAHGPIVRLPDDGSPSPLWSWNGDSDRPTLSPSIRVAGTVPVTNDEADRIMRGEPFEPIPRLCHSFVTDGQIQFLSDCTHALAGQTVPIPKWED